MGDKLTKLIIVVVILLVAAGAYMFYKSEKEEAEKDQEQKDADLYLKQKRVFDRELEGWIKGILKASNGPAPVKDWEDWWKGPNHKLTRQQAEAAAYYQMQLQGTWIPDGYRIANSGGNWRLEEIVF